MEDWGYDGYEGDNYTDSDRIDELNCVDDYNRFEEREVWNDISQGEGREDEMPDGMYCARCGDFEAPMVEVCEDCYNKMMEDLSKYEMMKAFVEDILTSSAAFVQASLMVEAYLKEENDER